MNEAKFHVSSPLGIHRLIKEPFDDREIFESLSNMINYCKNGTAYNGQKISCIFKDGNDTYIQNFMVVNNYPIALFNNIDYNIIKEVEGQSESYYVLIYYYNPINMENKNMNKPSYNINIDDPNKFSIIGLSDIFKNNNANYKLIAKSYNYDENTKEETKSEIIINDITDEDIIYDGNNNVLKIISNNIILYPNINMQENRIISLYIKANEYVKALGGALNAI